MIFETKFNDGDIVYIVQCVTITSVMEKSTRKIYVVNKNPYEIASIRIYKNKNEKYQAVYDDVETLEVDGYDGRMFSKLDDAKYFAEKLNAGDKKALKAFNTANEISYQKT